MRAFMWWFLSCRVKWWHGVQHGQTRPEFAYGCRCTAANKPALETAISQGRSETKVAKTINDTTQGGFTQWKRQGLDG